MAIPVRVRLGSEVDALTLEHLEIPTARGSLLPLNRLADVVRTEGPSLVNHDMAQRRVVVGFNVRGRDLGSVVEDGAVSLRGLELPEGGRMALARKCSVR